MEVYASFNNARAIPGVPTVFGERLPGNAPEKVIVREELAWTEIASMSQPVVSLNQILTRYKTIWNDTMGDRYGWAYNEAKNVFVDPESSNSTTLVTVAPGIFVTYNRFFVAQFCPEVGVWNIEWITPDAGEYRQVDLSGDDDYLVAELDNGGGLENIRIQTIPDHERFPYGEVVELYTAHGGIDFGEVNSMWVVIGRPELYAGITDHVFVFDVSADDPSSCWKLFSCGMEEEKEEEGFECPARQADMYIDPRNWVFGPEEILDAISDE